MSELLRKQQAAYKTEQHDKLKHNGEQKKCGKLQRRQLQENEN